MDDFFQFSDDWIGYGAYNVDGTQGPMDINTDNLSNNPQPVPDSCPIGDQNGTLSGPAINGTGQTGLNEPVEEIEPAWERVKWTNEMVKGLITAVYYIGHGGLYSGPIKGKWRIISNAMIEKGYAASPQQCEDKFNDLNRKYKRVRDILGSNSCDMVENPSLLEGVNIPKKSKDEIMKILTCKQLFYREMCSFHDRDGKYLPHDEILHKAVLSGLKGKKVKTMPQGMIPGAMPLMSQKKHGDDTNEGSRCFLHGGREELKELRVLQLKEKQLQMENEAFEFEKRKFEWMKLCHKQDREMEKMKLEVEMMRLENERMQFESKRSKRREMEANDE